MCISKAIRWTLAAVAAVAVAAGCGAPTRHTQAHERVGVTALVHPIDYFSTSGNDGTCRRGLRSRPCLTLDRACTLSRSGDFIVKIGGSRWARSTGCLVHLTQPSIAGATLFSTTALSASCGFASGISCTTVNYLIDGGQVCTSSTGPAFSCTWDTTSVANGTHTVQASATTSSGTRVSIAFNETVANSSGTSLANLWMSPTGTAAPGTGHCVWSASLIPNPDTGTGTTLCGPVKDAIAAAGNNPGIVGMVPGTYAAQNPSAPYTSSRTVTLGTCDTTVNRPGGWVTSENLSGCLTFQPADGGTPLSSEVTINGAVNAYSSGIRFLNITITNGSFGTNWRSGLGGTPCSGPKPHDIIFDGIRNYVTAVPVPGVSPAPGASFNFNSTDNYTVINSEIGPTYDGVGTAQSQDYSPSTSGCGGFTQPQIASSGGNIVSNYMHDDPIMVTVTNNNGLTTVNGNQTVAPGGQLAVNGIPTGWPAADFICQNSPACASNKPGTLAFRYQYSALGTNTITLVNGGTFADGDHINIQDCGGSGGPSDNVQLACNHAEAIHWRASNANILFNKFTNDGQYDINMQTITGNNTIDGVAIVGNVFDQPCSNQPTLYGAQTPLGVNDRLCGPISSIQAICTSGTDKITNFINAFNTVWGDNAVNLPTGACTGGAAFAGSAWYGNLTAGINSTACGWIKNNGGATDYNFRTTENSGVVCGTHDVASTTPFQSLVTNPLPTTYDFHLAGTLGTAFAPCSTTLNGQTIVAPAFAIDGTPRPTGASLCSAGAYEVATGASLATCAGGTCTEGALPSSNFSNSCTATPSGAFAASGTGWGVRLGQISDGIGTECRDYLAYVPVGLTGAAPLLVYGHGSAGCVDNAQFSDITGNTLDALANTNRFVVLMLGMPHPCTNTSRPPSDPSVPACSPTQTSFCQWFHHEADIPDVGPTPQDYTYIQAAIADIESRLNGGNPTFPGVTIDTKRLWYMGQSTGGGLATGIACNDATSSLFRGIAYDGLGYNIADSGGLPVSGSERCGGGGEPLATNKKFFFSQVLAGSNTGTAFNGSCAAGTHCIPSWTEVKSHLSAYFGCPAPTVTFVGSPSAVNENDTYNSCGYGLSPQVQGWVVVGAGDGYNTAAGKNGWVTQNILDFFNNSKWTGP